MRRWATILLCAMIVVPCSGQSAQTADSIPSAPPLVGLAHVALRVANLDTSLKFYARLGIHEAFFFRDGDRIGQAFLKVNDSQFIELYPVRQGDTPGFMHLCFTTDDANALHDFYRGLGLTPISVRKARAGNLLFTLEGPEKQNIEYTQILPGSLHFEDRGKHLDAHAIAESIVAVGLAMADPAAARSFYLQRLGFSPVAGSSDRVDLPGSSGEQLIFDSSSEQPHALVVFRVGNLAKAIRQMRKHGVAVTVSADRASTIDPDGNQLVFETGTSAR